MEWKLTNQMTAKPSKIVGHVEKQEQLLKNSLLKLLGIANPPYISIWDYISS